MPGGGAARSTANEALGAWVEVREKLASAPVVLQPRLEVSSGSSANFARSPRECLGDREDPERSALPLPLLLDRSTAKLFFLPFFFFFFFVTGLCLEVKVLLNRLTV